jgi:hypothetical protein
MSNEIGPLLATEQEPAIEQALPIEHAPATGQLGAAGEGDQLPPMTAEAARRLAAVLAPHLLAMRMVTAGTRYGACAGADPAAAAQAPPASAATTIFIAGMLERISA